MQMFYSAATGGFYCDEIHGENMPADVIEISAELYETVKGMPVEPGPDGMPVIKVPPAPSFEDRQAILLAAVDVHLNAAARAKGYDSIINAALRAALPASRFHAEGLAYGTWMDAVYAKCYDVLAEVKAGEIAEPNEAQLIAMLPELQLPA